jgi:hypothetical protein
MFKDKTALYFSVREWPHRPGGNQMATLAVIDWGSGPTATYVQTVVYILTLVVLIAHLRMLGKQTRTQQKTIISDNTKEIFREWWSDDFRKLREYFFYEFIPDNLQKVSGHSLKDLDKLIDDQGRTTRLCFFFDRIGWLGAAGLIDVDYVLGPMQHTMRKIWFVTEPLILEARHTTVPYDPVYQYGFEWLFARSEQQGQHQADLLMRRFSNPRIIDKTQAKLLDKQIQGDDDDFRSQLMR